MFIFNDIYQKHISDLDNKDKYRVLPELINKKSEYIDFSTNDYLCLSQNKDVIHAAKEAIDIYGVGATGSRLLSGNNKLFMDFERLIAKTKREESALIFNTGFQANFSVLSSLLYHKILKAKPIIFFDKNNHSSLYQAAFLSGAELIRFPHNNMQLLSELLNKSKLDNRPKFIVTETLFGMDGDILPIQEVKTLAKKYNAFLYLDEAHSTGILGSKGYGLSTEVDLSGIPHLIMGTFSKALGSSGAYVAGNKAIIDYIINKAPGFIYSTANSPANISASYKAWQLLPSLAQERKKILSLGDYLRKALDSIELKCGNSNSHIVPIIIGNEGKVLELKKKLLEQKIIVSAIRPPTVPPNNSSIRIALNSCHNKSDIDKLIKCLRNENNISI